jgi:predicted Zn-dependent protease
MLDDEQITTLRLLGHTYWRMGYLEKAEKLLKALLSLMPDDNLSLRQLAAIALESGRAAESLKYLDSLAGHRQGEKDRTVLLMRAQALWRLQRPAEAREVFGDYLAAMQGEEGGL